jgi:hypothetical protein
MGHLFGLGHSKEGPNIMKQGSSGTDGNQSQFSKLKYNFLNPRGKINKGSNSTPLGLPNIGPLGKLFTLRNTAGRSRKRNYENMRLKP